MTLPRFRILLGSALVVAAPLMHAVNPPIPPPPLDPPAGASVVDFDCHGNYWTLVDGSLHVLPSQDPSAWVEDRLSGVPDGPWSRLQVDEQGNVWLLDDRRLIAMDPRAPQKGWVEVSAQEDFPEGAITKAEIAASGALSLTVDGHGVMEVTLKRSRNKASAGIVQEPDPAAADWQNTWEVFARMPSGSHDLGGDVLDGVFYMDWAITGEYGYPSTGRFCSELLAFDPKQAAWRIVADYGLPRGYCAVGALDGEIWTVSGDALDEEKKRYTSVLSQIYNPADGSLRKGPDLPVPLPSALGLSSGGRLYVLGYPGGKDIPLKLFSIGKGETEWTEEADGPVGQGSSYGVEMNGRLYTVVDHRFIAIYDPETRTWKTTVAPQNPRSPAVGHVNGEIWVMGGRAKGGGSVVFVYNPDTDTWRQGPDLPRDLVWGCGFHIDGDLYVTGGYDYTSFNNRTFRLKQDR